MTTELIVSAVLFLALVAGITYFGYRRYARPAGIMDRISGTVTTAAPGILLEEKQPEETSGLQLLRKLGAYVPVSPADASFAHKELLAAGYRAEHGVTVFYGIKVAAAVIGVVAGVAAINALGTAGAMRMILVVGCGGVGYVLPSFILGKKIAKRQKTLRLSLPDALDLMVISVEAGLGLDQAIQHVSRELQSAHPEISEEWSLVSLEMRAGKRRADALRNMAERTGEPELRKLVAILVQADRFGTSMAESLRSHSDFMRTRRRQDAEERAGKVGVKLIFPIFLFVLPSMMIVTVGPALLQLFKQLFPMMNAI